MQLAQHVRHHDENERLIRDTADGGGHLYKGPVRISSFGRFVGDHLRYPLFNPLPRIRDRVEAIVRTFVPHTIGAHMRRTDNVKAMSIRTDERFFSPAILSAASRR